MIARPGSMVGFTTTDPSVADAAALATEVITGYDDFTCQITSATLTPTAGSDTSDLPGTFCQPAQTIPLPAASEWAMDISLVQDANTTAGLLQFLFDNDGVEGWVYVSTGATDKIPKFLGHVYLGAAAIGGAPATPLISDVSFRCIDKPIVAFGPTPVGLSATGASSEPEMADSAL
jgi:hypothetical protein